jgi:hypothetical protein
LALKAEIEALQKSINKQVWRFNLNKFY